MKKINFIFGVHNHQPIGNFDYVFEDAFQKSYLPFIDIIEKHPGIKIAYHNTGILFDWMEVNHPEFIERIKSLVESGQLELLTGGYYEPILSVIPDNDKIGQILKHKNYILNRFNFNATGLWLAERIWEQHIVKPISQTNVRYVVIDDTHFKYAGFDQKDLNGYFTTEEQGKTIYVFPINKKLRYTIPFRVIEETIEYLYSLANEDGNNIVVVADDGEKFGLWPDTYKSVYEEKWLDNFFSEIEKNSDWINMIHFSDALKNFESRGLIYLPSASYSEMMHWSLPSADSYCNFNDFQNLLHSNGMYEDYSQFVRGGFWRNFMAKYPESNHLHKKMLRVSNRATNLSEKGKDMSKVLDKIWMGQCNCPYWHGVFGGLYLPNLRSPIYSSLIEAENEMDKIENRENNYTDISDFNFDGKSEIILETSKYNLYFYPSVGGALYEIDYKPINFNLLNIISRREEGYHRKLSKINTDDEQNKILTKESGLESLLFYDWYRHGSLIDHFFGEDTTLEKVYQCNYPEQGDFVNQSYKHSLHEQKEKLALNLFRSGHVWIGSEKHMIDVSKQVLLDYNSDEIKINYLLKNSGIKPNNNIWFGIEFNFGLLAGNAPDRYYSFPGHDILNGSLDSKGEINDCFKTELIDEWLGIKVSLSSDKPATVWRFPIETISMDVNYFEKVYQSSVVILNWRIDLKKYFEIEIIQKIERL